MKVTQQIRTIPGRAIALALILMAVLVLVGLSGYLASTRHSATSATLTAPHTSNTSAPAMLAQIPDHQSQDSVPSDTSAPAMTDQVQGNRSQSSGPTHGQLP
jgi:hypothetical protein